MSADASALSHALLARGLITAQPEGSALAPGPATTARPWYIAALLGISGWVAGLFALGFIALLIHPSDPAQAGISGIVLLAAAWGLFMLDREGASSAHVFVAQLALTLSIAGQCLALFALTEHTNALGSIASVALMLQLALAAAMPNRLHRLLSTLFATIALAATVRFGLFGEPLLWDGTHTAAQSLASSLTGWSMTWLPVAAALVAVIRSEPAWMARGWQALMRPVASGLIVGLAVATLASQPFESFRWWGNRPTSTDWLALWPLLSATGAIGGMAAAFALRSRALVGTCALAALLHVGHFYYALGASLLIKSLLMLAMGAVALLVSRLLSNGGTR